MPAMSARARAERGKTEVHADEQLIEGQGRGEIRYKALLVALELLLP